MRMLRSLRRRRVGSTWAAAATLAAVGLGWFSSADAAVFVLRGGEQVEGRVLEVGERYLTVETASGARLIERIAVARVLVLTPSGERVSGRLAGVRDGALEIDTERGRVLAVDADGAVDAGATAIVQDELSGSGGPSPEDMSLDGSIVDSLALDDPDAASIALAQAGFPSVPTFESFSPDAAGVAASIADGPVGLWADRAASPQRAPIGSETDDVAVRGMLSGLIYGDESEGGPVEVVVVDPDDADPVLDRGFTAAGAAFASSPDPVQPVIDTGSTPTAAAPFASDAQMDAYAAGALGRATGRAPRECATLALLEGGPTVPAAMAAILGRDDPDALILRAHGDARTLALVDLAEAHLGAASFREGAAPGGVRLTATAPRPSLPAEIAVARIDASDADLSVLLDIGAIDIALVVGERPAARLASGASRLIGFDPIAVLSHEDRPVDVMSMSALAQLLEGRITDWSMVEPTMLGAPTIYAPAEGAPALQTVLSALGLRRIGAPRVRYVADPEERVRLARVDPNGVALASASTLRAMGLLERAVRIEAEGGPAAPTPADVLAARYPLTAPVFLERGEPTVHPSALVFFEELTARPSALAELGVIPITDCVEPVCALQATGLEEARLVAASGETSAINVSTADWTALGASAGSLRAPQAGGDMAAYLADVETLLLASDPSAGPATIVVRSAPGDADARRMALLRAEAFALAARCVGVDVREVVFDAAPGAAAALSSSDPDRPFVLELARP